MLLPANKARSLFTNSVTAAANQVASVTAGEGAKFVGVGGLATSAGNPMRCVITAVDANGNDTGAFEVVEITRSVDDLTLVSRGLEGTSAAAWGIGTVIEARATAGFILRSPRILRVGAGVTGSSATVATSIMPGGVAFSIPANTLEINDLLEIDMVVARRGGQNTQSLLYELFFGGTSFFGGTHNGSTFSPTIGIRAIIGIIGASSQAGNCVSNYGGTMQPNQVLFAHPINAAITIDLKCNFGAAATDTFGLEGMSILLHKGGS